MRTFRSVLCIVLSLAAVLSYAFMDSTYAWISINESVGLDATIALLDFEFAAPGFVEDSALHTDDGGNTYYLLPGDNLLTGVVDGKNYSTIQTEVRVQVKYTNWSSGSAVETIFTGAATDDITVDFSSGWGYDERDGCWHKTLEPESGEFTLINSIFYETASQDEYGGKTVTVSYVVQAKQKNNVSWETLTSDVATLAL